MMNILYFQNKKPTVFVAIPRVELSDFVRHSDPQSGGCPLPYKSGTILELTRLDEASLPSSSYNRIPDRFLSSYPGIHVPSSYSCTRCPNLVWAV